MTITPDTLREIEEKAKAATPGPWEADSSETRDGYGRYNTQEIQDPTGAVIVEFSNSEVAELREEDGDRWDETAYRNAAHIARMDPPTTLALTAALQAAWVENERLRRSMAGFESDIERVLKAYNRRRMSRLNDEIDDLRRAATAYKGG